MAITEVCLYQKKIVGPLKSVRAGLNSMLLALGSYSKDKMRIGWWNSVFARKKTRRKKKFEEVKKRNLVIA